MKAIHIVRICSCVLWALGAIALHALEKPPEAFRLLDDSAPRGSVVTIALLEEYGITDINIELMSGTETISKSKAHVIDNSNDHDWWISLLGIPSYVQAGQYLIRVEIHGHFPTTVLTQTLTVNDRIFKSESIALDERLTSIRVDNERERNLETQELIALFNTFNPNAYYHDDLIVLPVSFPRVTSHYGDRRVYRYADDTTAHSIHNGIDYGASTGTAVFSIASGKVAMSKKRIVTGNSVVIEHLPGIYSVYYHLDEMFVEVGETVTTGELIATVGSTGLSTGPHLHWELRVHGVAVDPIDYLSKQLVDINLLNQYTIF